MGMETEKQVMSDMETKKICISGLSRSEMDLVEMKVREVAQAILKTTGRARVLNIWIEDSKEKREENDTEDRSE